MTEDNEKAKDPELLLGKFKSVDALARAYEELEAEFTRRSQKLKALGEQGEAAERASANAVPSRAVQTSCAVTEPTEEKTPAGVLPKGVPLLGGAGAVLTAPKQRPKTIAEAGALALGLIRRNNEQGD